MDNPLFTIDPGLFIWSIIIFLLVLFILKRYAWTPLLNFIDEREKEISDSLAMAESAKADLEQVREESEKILNEAKQDAKKILDETRKKINRDIENKKNQFNLEIDKEIENAEKEIKTLKLSSIKDINKIAIETSSEIVRKIVGTEVNASSVSAIVEDASKKEITKYI